MYVEERVSIGRILLMRPAVPRRAKPYGAPWTPVEEIRNIEGLEL